MRRKKKSGAGKMIAAVVVVVILLCGIFAIMKNLASPASLIIRFYKKWTR